MAKSKELTSAIMAELNKYADGVIEEMHKEAKTVATDGRKKLKEKSPKKKGGYSKGWRIKENGNTSSKMSYIIYNAKKPGLTHLLENGHQLRQGGRAKAYPHIKPVEEWCATEFEKRLERFLKK